MKVIRVLMVLANLRKSNGVSSFAINYYKQLDHNNVKVDFVVYRVKDNPYENLISANGDHIFVLPSVKKYHEHRQACEKIIREGNYDIVHDNTLMISYPIMQVAKKYVPVRILHSHNSKLGENKTKEFRNRLTLPLLISTATDYAACSGLAAHAMFKNREFQFIPNIIDSKTFSFLMSKRIEVRDNLNVTNKFVVGTVGRPSEQKNPFYAIDIISEILKKVPNLEYWWVGSGPLDNDIKKYVHSKGIDEHVKLLGTRNDIADLYQAMDCFFLPSLFEGLPVTAIEAQAMGLPCLVSDTVTKELVYTDLVQYIRLSDKTKWVEALRQISLNRKRSGRTQELLHSPFSDVNAGKFLKDYYTELISKAGNEVNRCF